MKFKVKKLRLLKYVNLLKAHNTLKNDYEVLIEEYKKLCILSASEKIVYINEAENYKTKNKQLRKMLKEKTARIKELEK